MTLKTLPMKVSSPGMILLIVSWKKRDLSVSFIPSPRQTTLLLLNDPTGVYFQSIKLKKDMSWKYLTGMLHWRSVWMKSKTRDKEDKDKVKIEVKVKVKVKIKDKVKIKVKVKDMSENEVFQTKKTLPI